MCGIRGLCLGMAYLPVLMGVLMTTAVILTYVVAVVKNDESPFLPYISDAGVKIPERNLFSQLFNMSAFLAILTMYLRYKLVHAITQEADVKISRLNKFNFVLAFFVCFGLSLVANFQEVQVIEFMHLTGAMMVFGLGVVYAFIDASISFLMHPIYNGIHICRVRLTIAILGLVSLVTAIIGGVISREQWEAAGYDPTKHDRPHWTPSEHGYAAHLVSTCGEWALAFTFLLYFFTFIRDFQKFTVQITANMAVTHLDQEPFFEPDERTVLVGV